MAAKQSSSYSGRGPEYKSNAIGLVLFFFFFSNVKCVLASLTFNSGRSFPRAAPALPGRLICVEDKSTLASDGGSVGPPGEPPADRPPPTSTLARLFPRSARAFSSAPSGPVRPLPEINQVSTKARSFYRAALHSRDAAAVQLHGSAANGKRTRHTLTQSSLPDTVNARKD